MIEHDEPASPGTRAAGKAGYSPVGLEVAELEASAAGHDTDSTKLDTGQHPRWQEHRDEFLAAGPQTFPFLEPSQSGNELGWLAHYRVIRLLGQGGMGLVFLAEDPRLRRQLAIKVLRPELAQDNTVRQRFLREARATAAVRNDHIIAIYDIGQSKDVTYVATDLLRGEPLDEYLRQTGPLSQAEVVDLGLQIAQGLEAAHSCGLMHRDIKPANIWVEEGTRRIKILDFGLSRALDGTDGLTECGIIVGTPTYMAPEQVEGKVVDQRCDLFSLGCVLYEAAAGKKSFEATSIVAALRATALQDPKPLHELAPTLTTDLCNLVIRMLAKSPASRPASASEVIARLSAIGGISYTPVGSRAETPTVRLSAEVAAPLPPRSRKLITAAKVGVLLLAVGVGAFFVVRGKTPAPPVQETSSKSHGAAGDVPGVTDSEIELGMSAPFTGPSRELGREMKLGIETCFRHINDDGGIAGRNLRLVALDDGYEPDRALANMKQLHETDRVFAVIGNVGTPTAQQTLPYALSNQMIFLGAFTGAALLRRDPPDRYVFNYRASYAEETAAMVKYLINVRRVQPDEIAVFAQQDGYGDAGFNGVARTLRQHGRQPEQILRVGYQRNSAQVADAVHTIIAHTEIRAVIMVPTYRPAAEFIQQLKDAKRDLIFANVSFVGSDALAEDLRQMGPDYPNGVIVTQVVPHPDSHSTAVLKFRELLHKYQPGEKPGFVSLEGYVDALILAEALRRAGDELTTDTLIEALESIHGLDIGLGAPLNFGPSEHQASHKVWGTILDANGRFQNLEME